VTPQALEDQTEFLASRGKRAAAMKVVRSVFGPASVAMQSATVNSTALNRARRELAATISG
jgi:hypothetical protein